MSVFWIHPSRGVSPQRRHRSTQSFRRYRHRCKVSWRRDAIIKILCRFEVDALKLWKCVRWCRTCSFNNIFTDIEIFFSPDTSTSFALHRVVVLHNLIVVAVCTTNLHKGDITAHRFPNMYNVDIVPVCVTDLHNVDIAALRAPTKRRRTSFPKFSLSGGGLILTCF